MENVVICILKMFAGDGTWPHVVQHLEKKKSIKFWEIHFEIL